jgi:hypothetical protein
MKAANLRIPLFTRILAVHMLAAEPARYHWGARASWWKRLWNWLRAGSDWDVR